MKLPGLGAILCVIWSVTYPPFKVFLLPKIYTVDGRTSAPVVLVDIPVSKVFYTSQVVQDFFHQQYDRHQICLVQQELDNWIFSYLARDIIRTPLINPQMLMYGIFAYTVLLAVHMF